MVENKHGLGSILSFSAKSVNPKILEALLVGRKKIVNQLENKVKNIAKDGLNHQVLIVGARGTGKTHLLSVLHHRIQPFISKEKIKVAYFAEEEYGVSRYLDFMVSVLNAFIRWNEEDAEFLRGQLSILQETPSSHQEETIKRIVNEYVGDKPLLILAENFNDIVDTLKKEGQSKLRNWLQENERISIIATSQALSDDIGKEDKPFYGFFEEIDLKPLSLEESYQLLKKLAELENKADLIEHLETKGKAQVKAINTLVKGNHRLLITFYEFLKSDHLSNLSVLFIKTLNDLKPYYETYIRYQPAQQQKVIRFLALAKKPQKGVEIARECFIDQKSLSKQLSELSRKKLIEILPNPQDKRNKLYDIAEPLLRISIEIGEQKEGISALFIDFLALYYNQNELENQKTRFSKILEDCINPKEKQQYSFEIDARERALEIQEKITLENISLNYKEVLELLTKNKYNEAELILNQVSKEIEDYYYIAANIFIEKKDFEKLKLILNKATEKFSQNEDFHFMLAKVYHLLSEYQNAIKHYKESIKMNPTYEDSFLGLGDVYTLLNKYKEAIKNIKKAIKINNKNDNSFLNLGVLHNNLKQNKKATEFLKKAIEINSTQENSYLFLGKVYHELKNYREAKKQIEKALSLNSKNKQIYQIYGIICFDLQEYNEATTAIKKSIELDSKDIRNYAILVKLYLKNKKFKKATSALYKTISLAIEKHFSFDELDNLSNVFIDILKYDENISLEKCFLLEENIIKDFKNPKELQIPLTLIQTFRKVVLENKEEVLYELPKEQREFFNEKIIAFRKTL